jgi:carbamoyl-phosphate synthase small subunit
VKAVLVLKDGSVWQGEGFGAVAKVSGEVVFNTGMVGYPESITDPSYHGQILCQTYPLIGNYGINSRNFESPGPRIAGYITSESCDTPSHQSSQKTLHSWLRENGIPGIKGIDTRALTKKLRVHGVMLGILKTFNNKTGVRSLLNEVKHIQDPNQRDLVAEVTAKQIRIYRKSSGKAVVVMDCGAKESILRCLLRRNITVIRVPADTDIKKIMDFSPAGAVVSNGPGDPQRCCSTIHTVRKLMRQGIPVFGICLGNQILALAAGGKTYKMKYGHRSQNQPCIEEGTNRCFITSQNHGFAVDAQNLPKGWKTWFTNANDKTNEGIIHVRKPFMSIQFHPEARPGPTDTEFLFDQFTGMLK